MYWNSNYTFKSLHNVGETDFLLFFPVALGLVFWIFCLFVCFFCGSVCFNWVTGFYRDFSSSVFLYGFPHLCFYNLILLILIVCIFKMNYCRNFVKLTRKYISLYTNFTFCLPKYCLEKLTSMFWNITSPVASWPAVSSYTGIAIRCNIKRSRNKETRRHFDITVSRNRSFHYCQFG